MWRIFPATWTPPVAQDKEMRRFRLSWIALLQKGESPGQNRRRSVMRTALSSLDLLQWSRSSWEARLPIISAFCWPGHVVDSAWSESLPNSPISTSPPRLSLVLIRPDPSSCIVVGGSAQSSNSDLHSAVAMTHDVDRVSKSGGRVGSPNVWPVQQPVLCLLSSGWSR